MVPEALVVQRAVDLAPKVRENRIEVLKQTIEDAQRIKTDLEAEREWHLFRLSQIPAAMADVQSWMSTSMEELDILEGRGINNRHSIGPPVLETASVSHP